MRLLLAAILLLFKCINLSGQVSMPNNDDFLFEGGAAFKGSLVIAGGGVEPDNSDLYSKLVTLAGGAENASFAVIPAAGGVPVQSFVLIRSTLISYGVNPDSIHLIPVAVIDDDSTLDVDESQWKGNAFDRELALKIRECSAVWFTGGDQARVIQALYSDGKASPVLQSVWEVFRRGGVVGGTSAGAAIMSDPMIYSGSSTGAMSPQNHPGDTLEMGKGLGFFNRGLVDQHFEARARIGRLIVALRRLSKDNPSFSGLGFGVDENTALVFYPSQSKVEVAGASGVTIVDISNADFNGSAGFYNASMPLSVSGIRIDYLTNGDSYKLDSKTVTCADDKSPIYSPNDKQEPVDNENNCIPSQYGIFSARPVGLTDLLIDLVSCKGDMQLNNFSFYDEQSAYRATVKKMTDFEGYKTSDKSKRTKYMIRGARLDIQPMSVSFSPLN